MSRLVAVVLIWCAVVFAAGACGAIPRPGSAEPGSTHAKSTPRPQRIELDGPAIGLCERLRGRSTCSEPPAKGSNR